MKTSMKLAAVAAVALVGSGLTPTVSAAADAAPAYALNPMVVTATRSEQKLSEANASVSVISRAQIEDLNIDTVEAALRTVPGVQFLDYGSGGLNANLSGVRINGSKDVVILVDGVRVNDFQGVGSSGYFYANMLNNMDNIERIEVLRGAAGALYGSNAKGGVINIITRKAGKPATTVDISGGSFGASAQKVYSSGKSGRVDYKVYYGHLKNGDFKDGSGRTWKSDLKSDYYGAEVGYDVTKNNHASIAFDHAKSTFAGEDYVYDTPYEGQYKTDAVTIKDTWNINKHWDNEFVFRHNHVISDYAQPGLYKTEADYTYQFITNQTTFKDDRNTLTFGIDYAKGNDNLPSSARDANGKLISVNRMMKDTALFAQEEYRITDRLSVIGGLRYDKPGSDAYGPNYASHLSKSGSIRYDIGNNDSVYASYADFFILPSIRQLYDARWGNSELKPAEGNTKSIGWNHYLDDGKGMINANYFITKDTRNYGYDNDTQKYINTSDGVARGWNLQWSQQLSDRLTTTVGWAHLFQHAKGDNFDKGYYPKDLLTFTAIYKMPKWTIGLDGFYFIRQTSEETADQHGWPHDKYGVYNMNVTYSPNKTYDVYLTVNNIFNTEYAEHTNVIWGGKPGTWYSLPGRSYTVGVKAHF